MAQFAIAGHPLSHSFSPRYFSEKFAALGLSHSFVLLDTPSVEALPALVKQAAVQGFCITRPHKESILPYLYQASEAVKAIGACNCVQVDEAGRWYGHNTDAQGFWESLPEKARQAGKALILGNGGAAKAVRYALESHGMVTATVTRKPGEADHTYASLSPGLIADHTLLVHTSPVGTWPAVDECVPFLYDAITARHFLYDLVYNPSETAFMKQGLQRGASVQNGYEMLVCQAEQNWRLWTQVPGTADTGKNQ